MKEMYKSPVITVEELMKEDVLCMSGDDAVIEKSAVDNITYSFNLLSELEDIM